MLISMCHWRPATGSSSVFCWSDRYTSFGCSHSCHHSLHTQIFARAIAAALYLSSDQGHADASSEDWLICTPTCDSAGAHSEFREELLCSPSAGQDHWCCPRQCWWRPFLAPEGGWHSRPCFMFPERRKTNLAAKALIPLGPLSFPLFLFPAS